MKNRIKRAIKAVLYPLYERRLLNQLDFSETPHHVGVILDGNRRWAKTNLGANPEEGHRAGAMKIIELLNWCQEANVNIVTLWLLSTDNLNRDQGELDSLLHIIAAAVDRLDEIGKWEIKPLGALELLPEWLQEKLRDVEKRSKGRTEKIVNVAIGYGGRHEIVDAFRNYIRSGIDHGLTAGQIADSITIGEVGRHLYTAGMPDPELVIRTSGEQRLSGFLLWQSAHSEFYFCEAYWPDFRRVDFLRALRAYSQRHRRFGR